MKGGWTGVGIVVGGIGGAIAALLGAQSTPAPRAEPAAVPQPIAPAPSVAPPSVAAVSATTSASDAPAPSASPSVAAATNSAATPSAASPSALKAPELEAPATREALLSAEVICDQKHDFDACERAALALEQGNTGPADPTQAKRFRRIALTYLVAQCEEGSPHACFVMATKYRAGTELPASTTRAEALEQRGVELCVKRRAPECPRP